MLARSSCDEFNLNLRLRYMGAPLLVPDTRPSPREIVASEDGEQRLAGHLLRRSSSSADRTSDLPIAWDLRQPLEGQRAPASENAPLRAAVGLWRLLLWNRSLAWQLSGQPDDWSWPVADAGVPSTHALQGVNPPPAASAAAARRCSPR
jgi:hypothetical protein